MVVERLRFCVRVVLKRIESLMLRCNRYRQDEKNSASLDLMLSMNTRRGRIVALLVCLWTSRAIATDDAFEKTVAPILKQHCLACHGERKDEGELRLDTLGRDFTDGPLAGRWRDVADRIRSGEMPRKTSRSCQPTRRRPSLIGSCGSWTQTSRRRGIGRFGR